MSFGAFWWRNRTIFPGRGHGGVLEVLGFEVIGWVQGRLCPIPFHEEKPKLFNPVVQFYLQDLSCSYDLILVIELGRPFLLEGVGIAFVCCSSCRKGYYPPKKSHLNSCELEKPSFFSFNFLETIVNYKSFNCISGI